ncbi:MAG TPA: YccF domain-containing protein [Kineosporiaceae bacterium]
MRALLNIIWLVLSGFWLALGYAAAGVVMTLLVVTIPFAIASFRLAGFVLWPFGRTVVRKPSAGAGSAIGNVLWCVLAGLWIAIAHVVTAVALFVTIIGIPLAVANLKLAVVALAPLGKDVVDVHDPRAAGAPTF